MKNTTIGDLIAKIQRILAGERSDSDAAVILDEALVRVRQIAPPSDRTLLIEAIDKAAEARSFAIRGESPLPDGWPEPSLPGLIRIKTYPASRMAWNRGPENQSKSFMTLYRHIQGLRLAMTAPVVLEFANLDTGDLGGMAFLYRSASQGQTGSDGLIQIEDMPPLTVVSVGLKGAYRHKIFRSTVQELNLWLTEHPQWRQTGPSRVLVYNSPFIFFSKKYAEVQLPVEPVEPKPPQGD